MRLSRFFIAGLFIFLFAFGIQSPVSAQVCPPNPTMANPPPAACCIGSAGSAYYLAHVNECKVAVGYPSGGLGGNVPIPVSKQVTAEAAAQGVTCGSSTAGGAGMEVKNPRGQNVEYYGGRMGEIVGSKLLCLSVGCSCVSTTGGFSIIMMGPPPPGSQIAYAEPGALTTTTNYIAKMSGNKIISSTEYVADLYDNLRMPGVQPAYAQGLGFSALSPVLGLWKLFRNLSYFFFVVIFIVVGMMIMFRSKIGNQAAVTVQQALPKMIIALLLVTFSYAIAGLLVDVMYLIIYLMIGIFSTYVPVGTLNTVALQNNFIQNFWTLITGGAVNSIASALGNIVLGSLNFSADTPIAGPIFQAGSSLIFTIVLACVLLISIFKVFLALLQAYVGIFFAVIFAPIILLIGAFPGQNTFGTWLRGLLENLLVFPVLILMIFITNYFSLVAIPKGANTLGFSPPQLGSNQTQGGFDVYKALIPFACLLAIPEILKLTKGLMKGQIAVTSGDLGKNLKEGAGLGVPAVAGGLLVAPTGLWSGIQGVRKGSPENNALVRFAQGATIGYKPIGGGARVGGARQGIVSGIGFGSRIVGSVDRLSEGQVLDPTTSTRQLADLIRAENKGKGGKNVDTPPPAPPKIT